MSKAKIIDEKSEINILQERLFLSKMNNPFLVNMACSFQDKDNLYLVLQLLKGGDLRYHLTNYSHSFTETQLKFLFTNLILGLEYIHSKNIIHRDLKPENIIFDFKGYAYITDFGIAWSNDEDHEGDISGTPCYMAPEALLSENNQSFCVDFYSLGVIGYEIIMSKTPYDGNSRNEIRKQMEQKNALINIEEVKNFSNICIDFINGLLAKNPNKRLGAKSGVLELKIHPFFKGLNWDTIYSHKYSSPIYDIIKIARTKEGEPEELFDAEYCAQKDNLSESTLERYEKIKKGKDYSHSFENYEFICVDNILQMLYENESKIVNRASFNEQNHKQLNGISLHRSQSINNIKYPNIEGINRGYFYKDRETRKINYETKLQYYKNLSRSNDNIKVYKDLKLPYIQNKINENASREQKIKGYYENKLLKYKGVLNKLHLNYLKNEKLLNDQYKINKGKGFKVLIEKQKGNQTPKPIKIPEIQYNYNNLRYNNYDANYNQNQQQPLTDLNNNQYIVKSNYGYYQNNNCNCSYNIGSNCMNNCCCCCCCKKGNIKYFLNKMNIKRVGFFGKCKNDYYTGLCNTRCCCCCHCLIPSCKIGRSRPFVEIVESSTDEDEEAEEYEIIENYQNYPPMPASPAGPDLPPENKVINYETKKIYEYETRYYTKIIRVHKHIPRKRKPKVVKPKIVEPKKEEPKPKKEEPKPKKEEPKPKKEKPKPKKEEPKPEPEPEPEPKKEEPKKKKPKKKKPKKKKPKKEPEPEPKKAKAPSIYCSTCSRKITPSSEFSDLKQIEEEVDNMENEAPENNKNEDNDNGDEGGEGGEEEDEDN